MDLVVLFEKRKEKYIIIIFEVGLYMNLFLWSFWFLFCFSIIIEV